MIKGSFSKLENKIGFLEKLSKSYYDQFLYKTERTMDITDKLEEDFLFYLGFTNNFMHQMKSPEDLDRCRAWLQKLCGEPYRSVEAKTNRNLFLSQLVLCMEDGRMKGPFLQMPQFVDMNDANVTFGHFSSETEDEELIDRNLSLNEIGHNEGDGRTYLATRTMPGGEGAFAYLAVTLADDEPKWLRIGEGLDRHMAEKFEEMVPPLNEMEMILLRRKDPDERKRVLTFYDALLENIDDELDGKTEPGMNKTVNGLLEQLINDLKSKDGLEEYEELEESDRRIKLLLILHKQIYARRSKISKREQFLDSLEASQMHESFFDCSVEEEDLHALPAAMWEQVINREPSRKNTNALCETYPTALVKKFVALLSNEKESIAVRMQQRHENIVSQMKKELRKEVDAAKRPCEDAAEEYREVERMLRAVKMQYEKQRAAQTKLDNRPRGGRTEKSDMYERMIAALLETQEMAEDEAAHGCLLAEQIVAVNAQTENIHKVNDESIRRTEEANMKLMENINRLKRAVQQHEARLEQLRSQEGKKFSRPGDGTKSQMYIF